MDNSSIGIYEHIPIVVVQLEMFLKTLIYCYIAT